MSAEDLCSASNQCIAHVTLLDGRNLTTDEGICREFRDYNQKLFTRKPSLSAAQFDNYLIDFPHLEVTEAADCEGHTAEEEI